MKRNITIFFLAIAVVAVSGFAAQAQAPAAVVADLYKQHDAKRGPFFQTKSRSRVDKYFTKPLADMIWKDATTSKGEVGALDGDPLYDTQDAKIRHFAVGTAAVKGDSANVPVTFTNFGKKEKIDFSLKKVRGVWKIDNIVYATGGSLRKWFAEG